MSSSLQPEPNRHDKGCATEQPSSTPQFALKPRRTQIATLARPTSSAFRSPFEQKVEADAPLHGRYLRFARYPSRRQRAILRSASTSAFRSRTRARRARVGLARPRPVATIPFAPPPRAIPALVRLTARVGVAHPGPVADDALPALVRLAARALRAVHPERGGLGRAVACHPGHVSVPATGTESP